jgi:hypothetical protein
VALTVDRGIANSSVPCQVQTDLISASQAVEANYLQVATLLKEAQTLGYYRSWGYSSLDDALATMYEQGQISIGPDQAHVLLRVADLVAVLGNDAKSVSLSVLLEVSALPVDQQVTFLLATKNLTVDEIGQAVRENLNLAPWTLVFTIDQYETVRAAIAAYRTQMQLDPAMSDAEVLAHLVAGWAVK